MTSCLRLTFAVVLVCSGSVWSSSLQTDQAPQPTSSDQKTQDQSSRPATPQLQPAPDNPSAPTTTTGEKASPTPKPPVLKHRKRKLHHSSIPSSNGDPSKVVVRNGGAKEGSAQLTPAVNPDQAKSERANTASLLAATDANLKRVAGRQLTPAQQNMVEEINAYMRQARAAAASADTDRAQTLAYKAQLLSDELANK